MAETAVGNPAGGGQLVVGVVGCGTMGLGISEVAVRAGARVIAFDEQEGSLAGAAERLREGLQHQHVRAGLDTAEAASRAEADTRHFVAAPSLAAMAEGADLVIEAVVEDLPTKVAVFAELARSARSSAILATNTSALSVARIAATTPQPERVIGLHFFNPVPAMELVELVVAPASDPGLVERAEAIVTAWGKRAIRCHDSPGFIVNRVNRPFTLEALALLEVGGADVEAIDADVRAAGYPLGPFELMDLIGIDVNLAVAEAIHRASLEADDPLAERFRPSQTQRRMVAEGRLGRKSGQGFYRYPRDPSTGWASAAESSDGPAARIALAIILEAYRAHDAGVASRNDIDLALRLGARHPSGPFEMAARFGSSAALLAAAERSAPLGPRFSTPAGLLEEARAAS